MSCIVNKSPGVSAERWCNVTPSGRQAYERFDSHLREATAVPAVGRAWRRSGYNSQLFKEDTGLGVRRRRQQRVEAPPRHKPGRIHEKHRTPPHQGRPVRRDVARHVRPHRAESDATALGRGRCDRARRCRRRVHVVSPADARESLGIARRGLRSRRSARGTTASAGRVDVERGHAATATGEQFSHRAGAVSGGATEVPCRRRRVSFDRPGTCCPVPRGRHTGGARP